MASNCMLLKSRRSIAKILTKGEKKTKNKIKRIKEGESEKEMKKKKKKK